MVVAGMALLLYPPRFPELAEQVHVKVDPAIFEVRAIFVLVLSQICLFGGELERSGCGTGPAGTARAGPPGHPL